MKKIRAAVVGYGNIGQFTIQALEAAEDFEIAGVVRRNGADNKPAELAPYDVVKDIKELKDVDVAILATPTRSCEEFARFRQHRAYPHAEPCAQGAELYELRTWYVNGSLCLRTLKGWREERFVDDHPPRRGNSSPHGLCGVGGRLHT